MDQPGDVSGYSSTYDSFFMGAHLQQIQLFGIIPEARRDENYNHGRLVSLVLGRVSVALFFITSVVISYFKLNWGISVIIAIAVVALILILREDLTQYSRLETRFLANLNRREEAAKKRHPLKTSFNSEFNDKDLDLTSVVVSPYSDYIGKSLGELSFRQNFGVNVVAITRGDLNIYNTEKL